MALGHQSVSLASDQHSYSTLRQALHSTCSPGTLHPSILQAFASHIQELGVDHGSLPAFQRLREVIKAAQAGGEGQM